jgi:sortase A
MEVGDTVTLRTPESFGSYVVVGIRVVKPDDVAVLEERGVPILTLVTCYPFYFVGNAPLRYVAHCAPSGEKAAAHSRD